MAVLRAAGLLCLLLALPASAQVVTGRVVDTSGGEPVVGVLVVLVDEAGEDRGSVLSGDRGGFQLRAPAPGTYRLRTERIGYRSTWSEPFDLEPQERAVMEIRASMEAIALEGIDVETRHRCRRLSRDASAVAEIWEEARKALAVARVTAASPLQYRVARYTRRLEADDLTVLEDRRTGRSGFHRGSPFVSRPAEQLAMEGYVVPGAGRNFLYFGPDAEVLLSSTFLDQHCFGLAADPEDPSRIGLTFEPVRDRRLPDVTGVIWLERRTAELRYLEYAYTRLPWAGIPAGRFGGRVDFERLATGDRIVRRWRIRMPVVAERRRPSPVPGARGTELYVAEVLETGGQVEDVRNARGEVLARATGVAVEGTVREVPAGAPLSGARVWLEGTALETRSDGDGTFRLVGVPEGRYVVRFSHPATAGIAAFLPAPVADVREAEQVGEAQEPVRVDLAIPTPAELARGLCPAAPDSGIAYGRVTDPETGRPVEGAVVFLTWSRKYGLQRISASEAITAPTGDRNNPNQGYTTDVAITESWEGVRTTTSADGTYHVCELPPDQLVLARAWAGAPKGAGGGTLTVTEMAGQTLQWAELRIEAGLPIRADLVAKKAGGQSLNGGW